MQKSTKCQKHDKQQVRITNLPLRLTIINKQEIFVTPVEKSLFPKKYVNRR